MENIFFLLPVFIMAVVVHEMAHAYVAFRLGDPTAKELGRLTLNPIKHISLFGSILLPFLLYSIKSPILFAWAKPVPINPQYFSKPLEHMGYVAIAGPLSNFAMALVFTLAFRLLGMGITDTSSSALIVLQMVCEYGVAINVVLGMFNLLPIPPLDGSRIATALLPLAFVRFYARLERVGLLIVFIVILFLGNWLFMPIKLTIQVLLAKEIDWS